MPVNKDPSGDRRKLTSIELTVLGLAWLRGPCTIYAIMKELSLSASSFHKSRAGTAYSVAKRLLKTNHLEKSDPTDSSSEGDVQVSESGVAALKHWLTAPLPMADIAHSADLIRLRFFFLGAVEKNERVAFIDKSIEGLQEFLSRCESLLPDNEAIGDYFGVLATMSSIFETRARIEWLKLVREFVVNPLPENASWTDEVLKRYSSQI